MLHYQIAHTKRLYIRTHYEHIFIFQPIKSNGRKRIMYVRIHKTKNIEPDTNQISTACTQVPHKLKVSSRVNLSFHMY